MVEMGAGSHACIDGQLEDCYADHTYRARLDKVYIVPHQRSISHYRRLNEWERRVSDNEIF